MDEPHAGERQRMDEQYSGERLDMGLSAAG
jgi:hypothetical protein